MGLKGQRRMRRRGQCVSDRPALVFCSSRRRDTEINKGQKEVWVNVEPERKERDTRQIHSYAWPGRIGKREARTGGHVIWKYRSW